MEVVGMEILYSFHDHRSCSVVILSKKSNCMADGAQ